MGQSGRVSAEENSSGRLLTLSSRIIGFQVHSGIPAVFLKRISTLIKRIFILLTITLLPTFKVI